MNRSIIKRLAELAVRNNKCSPLEVIDIKEEFGINTDKIINYHTNNYWGNSLIISIANEIISIQNPKITVHGFNFKESKLIHIYEDSANKSIIHMSIYWTRDYTTCYTCTNTNDKVLYFKWHGRTGTAKINDYSNSIENYIDLYKLNTKLLKLLFNVDLDNYLNTGSIFFSNSLKNIEIPLD